MSYIEILFLNACIVWGFYFATSDGMVLDFIRTKYLSKPLYDCPICMSSIHSAVPFFYFFSNWWEYPFYVLALAGINAALTYTVFKDV